MLSPRAAQIKAVKKSQGSQEWYTPERYIEAAREVFGGAIELDPASSIEANRYVKAQRIFTKENDGRLQRWQAKTLWLNAPGSTKVGQSGQAEWQRYLLAAYKAGDVKEAIMLIFNTSGTETQWFQELLGNYPLCMVNHRIKFIPPKDKYVEDKDNQPVHGNAFAYFGPNEAKFTEIFSRFGKVIPAFLR